MRRELIPKSKFLSLVLRHDPSAIGVRLEDGGWIALDVLLPALQRKQADFTRAVLDEIVATNEKRRFVVSPCGQRIRAAQGHSLRVDLGLPPADPPAELFHGTAERHVASILASGLLPGERDFVHLSERRETALEVGARHGRPVVLLVAAGRMAQAGHTFHVAENGVWLTHEVPVDYLRLEQP